MPQAALHFTSYADGGAIALPHELHIQTRTYWARGVLTAQTDVGLSFRAVLAKDLRDLRALGGKTYNEGMQNLIDYYRKSFTGLMRK